MANINCNTFTQLLVHQTPVYDKLILEDIRPTDSWIGHMETGVFPNFSDVTHTIDRFHSVFPDTTQQWSTTSLGDCTGTPCDKTENEICWGNTRITYYLEEQSWRTPLLCYDQQMHVTHAKEHFRQIISKILKPATSAIMSNFMRKRAAQHSGTKWVADAAMTAFTYNWVTVGTREVYVDATALPTSKLTPSMLQRRVHPLMLNGYLGEMPFKDMPPLIELVTDMETCWELDKLACNSTLAGQWRFQDWSQANKYWKYAFQGQLGNYAVRVDPLPLRFNYVGVIGGNHRFQVVLPYTNGAATNGLKSDVNDDYQNAQYQFSLIWHRRAMRALVSDARPINPEMPYSARDFGGKWQFVMDNLGADPNGCVIENKRRNKGMFIADFKLAIQPNMTEFCELIFHKREPACLEVCSVCNSDPGYPAQSYDSACTACD